MSNKAPILATVVALMMIAPLGVGSPGAPNATVGDPGPLVAFDPGRVPDVPEAGPNGTLPDPPTLPGGGAQSPWVDTAGDTMTGELNMGANRIRIRDRFLESPAFEQLSFAGRRVCQANVVVGGCGAVELVGTGAGLTGGPITMEGTISIADGGVTSEMIADGSVDDADYMDGSITGAKLSSDGCPDGGSWVFSREVDPAPAGFSCEVVPSEGGAGIALDGRSIALSSEGCPDGGSWRFRRDVEHREPAWSCTGLVPPGPTTLGGVRSLQCSQGSALVGIDETGSPHCAPTASALSGLRPAQVHSLMSDAAAPHVGGAVPDDGLALLLYEDQRGRLIAAKCTDVACTRASPTVVETDCLGCVAEAAIGLDGNPVIALLRPTPDGPASILVVKCSDMDCVGDKRVTPIEARGFDPHADTPGAPGIAAGLDGHPAVAYWAENEAGGAPLLRVVKCGDDSCSSGNRFSDLDAVMFTPQPDPPGQPAIALGLDGFPVLAFPAEVRSRASVERVLGVVVCVDAACTGVRSSAILATASLEDGQLFGPANVMVGPRGRPVVAFLRGSELGGHAALMIGVCGDGTCSEANVLSSVDEVAFNPQKEPPGEPWLAMGPDHHPAVAYVGGSDAGGPLPLRLALCLNEACTSSATQDVDAVAFNPQPDPPGEPWLGFIQGRPLLAAAGAGEVTSAEATMSDGIPVAHPPWNYLSLSPADFRLGPASCDLVDEFWGRLALRACPDETFAEWFAPVHLPTGAVLVDMTVTGRDANVETDLWMELVRIDLFGLDEVAISSFRTEGDGGSFNLNGDMLSFGNAVYNVVDNEQYAYMVRLSFFRPGEPEPAHDFSAIDVRGVRLSYWGP